MNLAHCSEIEPGTFLRFCDPSVSFIVQFDPSPDSLRVQKKRAPQNAGLCADRLIVPGQDYFPPDSRSSISRSPK
jgi:hypothetical protein